MSRSIKNLSKTTIILLLIMSLLQAKAQSAREEMIVEGLSIMKLSDHLYLHISDFVYQSQIVKCNGLIYINQNEAIICDTPTDDTFSKYLLDWMDKKFPDVKVKALIVNHFHADCLGGIAEFHRRGIASYGHELGPKFLKEKEENYEAPQNLFKTEQEIKVGNQKVFNYHFGAAHTRDNIITWIPAEKALFGGCMVKALDAPKGNLADADVNAWPKTIKAVKKKCPDAALIVPGHGDVGGQTLLDYTATLFSKP